MNITAIHNKRDYAAALERLGSLMDAKKGTPESDELKILALLIGEYESEHFPIETPDPISAIKFYLEQNGLTNKDLEGVIGPRNRVHDVMTKKRPLSITMIRALVEKFAIPADILVREYSTGRNRERPRQSAGA
ncbi:MAG: transcriptional regulator [Spirochaetes bacterium]|nr:MAG: transcriptional regulator [Spirochaetota bacterium]